jgi:hypothetical protein
MISQHRSALVFFLGLVFASAISVPATSMADTDDPPTRVARLAYLEGSISFQPGGTDEWPEALDVVSGQALHRELLVPWHAARHRRALSRDS